jgi:hypothetical protein
MDRLFFIMGLLFIFIVPQAWGQSSQYPNPNRQTTWNNITDKVHTWGKTPAQAAIIKRRLHTKRTQTRIRNINKAKQQAWLHGQN